MNGDGTPKEETYMVVFYCYTPETVLNQRQSGKQRIVVGFSLPSLTPSADDMKLCTKQGGVVITGYAPVTPPFARSDEGVAATQH